MMSAVTATYVEQLEEQWPTIKWREPLRVTAVNVSGYACRVCIAREGLKGSELHERLFATAEECSRHLWREHGVVAAS